MPAGRGPSLLFLVVSGGACASVLGLDSGSPLDAEGSLGEAGTEASTVGFVADGAVGVAPRASFDGGPDPSDAATSDDTGSARDGPGAARDGASTADVASAADTACVPESITQACGAKQCGTAVNDCGQTVSCGADGGTGCAASGLCGSDGTCCTPPSACNATVGCCGGTYCWAGDTLADDGTCQATACPVRFAPCVAVGDCCFGFVCQGNEQSGYFCQ